MKRRNNSIEGTGLDR